MMKRLIIYDLDGTLADTREDITRAANHMLKEMGKPRLPSSQVAGFVGRGLHHLIQSCLQVSEEKQIERGARIYRTYYAKHLMDHTRLYPGALETLDFFKLRGSRQAVITNKPNPFSDEILRALGIRDYFSDIVAGNSDFPRKPDPAAVKSLMKQEGIGCDETLFVGDSLIDIETGRNAAVTTVVITHGFMSPEAVKSANPDALAGDFREFLKLMTDKGW